MSPQISLALQYVVVGLAVVVSAWTVLHKQAPSAARRLRIALAAMLMRDRRPAWLRALGKRIAPAPKPLADGCAGCDRCGTDGPHG